MVVIGPPGVEPLKLPFLQPVSDGEGESILLGHGLGGFPVVSGGGHHQGAQFLQFSQFGLVAG